MESVMLLAVVPDDQAKSLITAMKECSTKLFPEEGMRAFVMPVEEAI
jgi:hypothetical protein